jgi:tripartite-type tricarboxylate transporter receptor subunit TctC
MRYGIGLLLGLAGLIVALHSGHADDYPARRISLIAPWPPAGAIDVLCRELAPGVGDRLGQPIVVENKPGAGSIIGTNDGAKAKPDGYTLLMAGTGSLAISPTLYKTLPYDPKKDFAPIALVAKNPFVLVVNPALPIQTVADLIKYAKEHPGSLTYGSGGLGSPHQLFAEMFKTMTGVEMAHVPYKGTVPALTDLMAGHISSLRDVGLPGFDATGWGMVVAPAGTPGPVIAKLYEAFRAVVADESVREKMITLGMIPQSSPPPDKLQDFIDAEQARWGQVVREAGLAGAE